MKKSIILIISIVFLFSCKKKEETVFKDRAYLNFVSDTISQNYFQKELFQMFNKKIYRSLITEKTHAYHTPNLKEIYPIDKIHEDGGFEETVSFLASNGNQYDTTIITPFDIKDLLTNYQLNLAWKNTGGQYSGKIHAIGFFLKGNTNDAFFWIDSRDFKNIIGKTQHDIFGQLFFVYFLKKIDRNQEFASFNPLSDEYKIHRDIRFEDVAVTSLNQKLFNEAISGEADVYDSDSCSLISMDKLSTEEVSMRNAYTESITLIDSTGWPKDTILNTTILAKDFKGYIVSEIWYYNHDLDLFIRKNSIAVAPIVEISIANRYFDVPHYWLLPEKLEELTSASEYDKINKSIYQSLLEE